MVMDYIEGESLKEKLRREKTIPAKQVIDWARQLSEVLAYLHTRKPHPIIYRDMKPDNIMLTPEGKIKLIDFGIAREFKTESSTDTTNLGTKSYAAPEQMSGKQTDARTDIYSLGVTLYHLVTGKSLNEPPFELKPIRHWNSSLPEGLEHIITKATQSEPTARYQSCSELSYDLENINKLTAGYKSKLRRKLSIFLIPVVLFLAFSTTSVLGYKGIKNTQFQDYMSLVNASTVQLMNGEDTKAIERLEKAITTVDKTRPEAYINLLDLYSSRDETDTGLAKIETYIEDKYGDIQKNNEIRFKMGMTYFDKKRNYSEALKHFNQVDTEIIPDAKYYESLAATMISMNIDYQMFTDKLIEFEKFNDRLPNERRKIDNYHSLANIYISYKGQIPEANTKAIEIVGKAYDVIDLIEAENLLIRYEVDFEQKLAQAFYSRGVNSKDQEAARADYEQAIEHYQTLLDLNASNEEDVLVKIGVIYQEMGESARAAEQFKRTMKKFPASIDAFVKLGSLLLDIEQSKEESSRNYQEAQNVYQQLQKIEGAEEDEAFKKLTRRFDNLSY